MPKEHPVTFIDLTNSVLSVTGHPIPKREEFATEIQFMDAMDKFHKTFVPWDRSSCPMEYHTHSFTNKQGVEEAPERMYYEISIQAKDITGKWVNISDASLYSETRQVALVSYRMSIDEQIKELASKPEVELIPDWTESEYKLVTTLFKIHKFNPGTNGKKLAVIELRKILSQQQIKSEL